MVFQRIKFIIPLWALFLAACQTSPKPIQHDAVMDLQQCDFSSQKADSLLQGSRRLLAKTAIKSDELSEQATIIWQTRQDGSQHIRLHGPLGSNAVELEFDQHHAVLTDNKGRRYYRDSAATLLAEIIDWPLPISALQHWVLGKPLTDEPCQFKTDGDGQIAFLLQNGWQVEYQDYQLYEQHLLPRKIKASKTIDSEEVVVKMVVREWQWY